MKYKVGDLVRIVDTEVFSPSVKVGDIAEITEIIKGDVVLYFSQYNMDQHTMFACKDFRKVTKLDKALK